MLTAEHWWAILSTADFPMGLSAQIRDRARSLGFDLAGVAPAVSAPTLGAYHAWLARGYHGEMAYMAQPDRVRRREAPTEILPGARSVVSVGLNHYPGPPPSDPDPESPHGLVSNYAWGYDYHDLMMPRLKKLAAFVTAASGGAACRPYIDTGPVLERAYAAVAGLGFIGKNTCLIHPRMGSWLFLGEILTDAELEPASQGTDVRCGTCRRCLDACPTGALVAPYVLDARRCISYLTIELKGPIPAQLRAPMATWIYGCDVCQTVCPWQRFAQPTCEQAFLAANRDCATPRLPDLLAMDEEGFRGRYRGSPIQRIGRERLLRNAAVALGNAGDEGTIPALVEALSDGEPLVRGHAAWALGRIGGREARKSLEEALQAETDRYVQGEIQRALTA